MTIHRPEGDDLTLKIEGRIEGFRISELQRAWRDLESTLGERRLRVDLRGVTHIDEAGQYLLAEIHTKTRAEFVGDTPLTKYFAEQAQQGIRTTTDPIDGSRRKS